MALLELEGFPNGVRVTREEIAKRAFGEFKPKSMEIIMRQLKELDLVEVVATRGGGARLTALGHQVALRIQRDSRPQMTKVS